MTEVHYISMIIIGVGSFIFGILPMVFSVRTRSYPFVLSLILCLGAGILLATSLVHMLTEVQLKLKLYAQLYFCGGFLILYFFDEITHYCMRDKLELQTNVPDEDIIPHDCGHYGTFSNQHDLSKNSTTKKTLPGEEGISPCYSQSEFRCNDKWDEVKGVHQYSGSHCSHSKSNDENEIHCHLKPAKPCSSNPVPKTGLFIALFVHSVLEGLSIGVQTEISQILFILGAVSFHKVVLSFCLGLEIQNNGVKTTHLLLAIFLFSIGSPIGIFVGMTVTSYEKEIFGIDAQLQAIAAGSLLYVAVFEVLPRERLKWKHGPKKAAGIFQLTFLLIGFTFITLFHLFVDPLDHNGSKNETRPEEILLGDN